MNHVLKLHDCHTKRLLSETVGWRLLDYAARAIAGYWVVIV